MNIQADRWFKRCIFEQLSNVGCELDRAVRRRNKGELEDSKIFFNIALKFLQFTIDDPKHTVYRNELIKVKHDLIDYFLGNNENDTTDEQWYDYFMFFNYIYALQKENK